MKQRAMRRVTLMPPPALKTRSVVTQMMQCEDVTILTKHCTGSSNSSTKLPTYMYANGTPLTFCDLDL